MPEQCQGSYVCIVNVNNNFQLTDNAARFVAGSSEKSKAYLRTFDVSGRLFQLALSESGLLFSGYNGDYGSSGKTLWKGVTKSDMEIETHNLVSLLNPDFYDSNSDKWLKIYRVGNIKVIDFGFKTKALTGKDTIATDIPENLRPITAFYGGVQARDTGEWAKATYFPAVLIVTGNNLELSTGTNASRSMYVSGTVCYV